MLFGGPISPPKEVKPEPWPNRRPDILLPCQQPYLYGHNAKPPNTNYNVQLLLYNQRLKETLDNLNIKMERIAKNDEIFIKYNKHNLQKDLQRDIRKSVAAKIKAADEALEVRRHKLMEMLSIEERQFYYETVDQAQRGKQTKLSEMKEKSEQLKIKRENDRLKLLEEKRFLQYKDRNELLLQSLSKLHCIEAKMINLQQMRENEAKRESERETDKFYHNIMMKDIEAKTKREEQDAIKQGADMKNTVDTWNQQIRGKELLRQEIEAVKDEDREEIQRTMKQNKEEIYQEKLRILKEKETRRKDLKGQIDVRTKFLSQKQQKIDALDKAFAHLNELELAKEQQTDYESRIQARREMLTYKKYVDEVRKQKIDEEKRMQEIIESDQKAILKKQDDVKCKIKAAKEKLIQDVYAIRARQLEEKAKMKGQENEEKEKEDQYTKKIIELNKCLDDEYERSKLVEKLEYREDLCAQMAHNEQIKINKKEELDREHKLFEEEEKRYLDIVQKMVQEKIEGGSVHPFREVLNEFECFCEKQKQQK